MKFLSLKKVFLLFLFTFLLQCGIAHSSLFNEKDINATPQQQLVRPENEGLNATKLSEIQFIVKQGIYNKAFPGCQVLVMKNNKIVYNKAFGTLTYDKEKAVNEETLYDLASLTKTTATLFAVMKLYDEGKIKLSDKASDFLIFLKNTDKEDITIRSLLFHTSGLTPYLSFYTLAVEKKSADEIQTSNLLPNIRSHNLKYKTGMAAKVLSDEFPYQVGDSVFLHSSTHSLTMEMIVKSTLRQPQYLYSCINFILLKEIVENITQISMDEYLKKEFYEALGLTNLTYLPLRTQTAENIAPTLRNESFRNGEVRGYVHDPAAAFLGGISGNAGLFGNAQDIAHLYNLLLNKGEMDGKRYLSAETCQLFIKTKSADGLRGLGFARATPSKPNTNPCGLSASANVFGHTGYTGTCVWIDPENNMIYVFLSNRTYPNDSENKLAKMKIRPAIHEVIYQSFLKQNK